MTVISPSSAGASVFPLPQHSTTNGQLTQGIAFPRWIDHGHLIGLGRMIKRGAGTLYASSVDVDPGGDTIHCPLGGDTKVYRRALASGVVDTLFDFGGLGIARDVRMGPDRLIAVVGGAVTFAADSLLGMIQTDSGGTLMHVRHSTGTVTPLSFPFEYWQHPVLAPDGSAVVAESARDLWRIRLP